MSLSCQNRKWPRLFDHLVSEREQRRRNRKSERFRSLHVDYQLESGWLHDWQIRRLCTVENFSRIHTDLTIRIGDARSIAKQAAVSHDLAFAINGRNAVLRCQPTI